jgi:uncharacterized membrane protein (UPF0127 family)
MEIGPSKPKVLVCRAFGHKHFGPVGHCLYFCFQQKEAARDSDKLIFRLLQSTSPMRKFFIPIILSSLLVLAFFAWLDQKQTTPENLKLLKINSSEIFAEIADTSQKRNQGLSGRASLPRNQGMLFIFDRPDRHSFWMKDMNFPLDFVWINKNRVIEITENVRPPDFQPPQSLTPKNPADMVLEINAGLAKKINIKIGDKINF